MLKRIMITARKSMDWFLYDNGLRLERVKKYNFGAPPRTFKRFSLLNYREKKNTPRVFHSEKT